MLARGEARAHGHDHGHAPAPSPLPVSGRPAAVLVLMAQEQVVLTQRPDHLTHHPGQISFPGGACDPGDADAIATALRECQEEIGLDPSLVEVISTLPSLDTRSGFSMTPVLGRLRLPAGQATDAAGLAKLWRPDPYEVAEVFTVPLVDLLDPRRHERWRVRLESQTHEFYVIRHEHRQIWGATAAVLRTLYETLARLA